MIQFAVKPSLLDENFVYLITTVNGKQLPKQTKVKVSQVNAAKNEIVKAEIRRLLTELNTQRENVFSHTPQYMTSEKLTAFQAIKSRMLSISATQDMADFFYRVLHIIPFFHIISPSATSRYKTWRPTLDAIEQFAIKCYNHYSLFTTKQNTQYVENQLIKSVNTHQNSTLEFT